MRTTLAIFVFSCCASAQTTLFRVQKFCEVGGQTVNVQGLNSTTHVQRSFPRCTVEVFLTGTTTHPSNIYSDNLSTPTPLANPFTANTDGSFGFYAATTACYDIVTSGGNTGDQFPAPFTYTNICSGGTGGGGPGITPGTPFQIPRYDATGTNIQDSTGSDNPANGPTRWPSGITVVNNAGYRQFNNSPSGTSANLSVCIDTSVTSTQQVKTCTAGSSNAIGIADSGGTSGNVQVAMIGFHAAVFTGQTTINDYFGPSATVDGQFDDFGASKPTGVEVMGHVTSLNSGAGTLATVDLFTGDTIAPGASGGSGTVSACASANSNALFAIAGTTIVCDPLFTDDGVGNGTMVSLGLTDATKAGFLFQKQGPAPTISVTNSVYVHAPTSVASSFGLVWPGTKPTGGNCAEWFTSGSEIQIGDSGSPCGSGGSGSVTSVSQVSPNGVLSQSGGPITTSGTFTWVWAGTSGGIPYFCSVSQMCSSALLTANLPVFGGGAGTAPFSGTRSGNTTQVATVTGSLTSGHCGQWDASGNITDSGSACGGGGSNPCADGLIGNCPPFPNDTITGTFANVPVIYHDLTNNAGTVQKTTSASFGIGWRTGFLGICSSGCGTSGFAQIKIDGQATCQFEASNTPTKGDYVKIGSNGFCLDVANAAQNENPEQNVFFGIVNATGSTGGTAVVDLLHSFSGAQQTSADGHPLSPTWNSLCAITPGASFCMPSPFYLETYLITGGGGNTNAPVTAAKPAVATSGAVRLYNGTSGGYNDIYTDQNGTSRIRTTVNSGGEPGGLRVACDTTNCVDAFGNGIGNTHEGPASFYSPPDVQTSITGSVTYTDSQADGYKWTLSGNLTMAASAASINVGHVVRFTLIQDGTGGRKVTWPTTYINPPTVDAAPNAITTAEFWWADSTHAYCIGGCTGPIRVVKTAQGSAISTTTMANLVADSTYRVSATLDCDSSSAAATVNVTIGWTDPSNTAQSATLGSAVVCTTLGSASIGTLTTAFRAKSGTAITYSTSIVNTPTYDLVVALETLTAN